MRNHKCVICSACILMLSLAGCCSEQRRLFRQRLALPREGQTVDELLNILGRPDWQDTVSGFVEKHQALLGDLSEETTATLKMLYLFYRRGDLSKDLGAWANDDGFLACDVLVYDERFRYRISCGYPVTQWLGTVLLAQKGVVVSKWDYSDDFTWYKLSKALKAH